MRITLNAGDSLFAAGAPLPDAAALSRMPDTWNTSFSFALTSEYMQDFADMAGIEYLQIDEKTNLQDFRDKLRWNDLYYHLAKGL